MRKRAKGTVLRNTRTDYNTWINSEGKGYYIHNARQIIYTRLTSELDRSPPQTPSTKPKKLAKPHPPDGFASPRILTLQVENPPGLGHPRAGPISTWNWEVVLQIYQSTPDFWEMILELIAADIMTGESEDYEYDIKTVQDHVQTWYDVGLIPKVTYPKHVKHGGWSKETGYWYQYY